MISLFDILVPHTNFNKSQPTVQGAVLTLSENSGRNQREYIILHINQTQIHFYLIAVQQRDTSGQNVLNANFPMRGVGSERVDQN